ncbi:cytochrome P450 [Natrononativus amylolyticus]|uniref:cytochrome P450 n=1 Tax=Natrononativus amylolyticus TaxID=2963434 RepID=UPI0020CC58A4|nr:cytochrome P450 [Natrononativus amylolyticus]
MTVSARPPGPRGAPVVGVIPRYARDPFRFMTAVRDAYGDVAAFDFGPVDTYMVTSPEGIERVLVGEEHRYSKPDFQTDAFDDLLGEGLLLSEGDLWRERRQLAGPAFAPARIDGLAPVMADRAAAMVDRWTDGEVRDLEWEMARVTLEIIVEAMFGVDLPVGLAKKTALSLEPIGSRFEPDPRRVVVPDWLPTPENREFARSLARLEEVVDELISRRRRNGIARGDRDLLALLLRAEGAGRIDETGIRDELVTMLLAGHDTTALVLTYTWALLSENPDVEGTVHDEVVRVLGDEPPTAAAVRKLETLRNALRESMRLYPPVYVLFRQADETTELAGYEIPAGSFVMLPQWAVHRDPRYFRGPERFDPDRWREPTHSTYAYFPFGAGPRGCIGRGFTMLEAPIIAATVIREFRLERRADGPIPLRGSLTVHPADGMEMRLHRRDE